MMNRNGINRTITKALFGAVLACVLLCQFSSPARAQAQPDITTGLVGHWKLDETTGTTAADSGSGGTNGTLTGGLDAATDSVSGRIGNALTLNGSSDYISLADIDFATGGYTITAWLKTNTTAYSRVISNYSAAGNQKALDINGTPDSINCSLHDGTNFVSSQVGVDIDNGQWHFVACVVDGTNATAYADGNWGTPAAHDNGLPTNNSPWVIGRRGDSSAFEYFNGTADDVRIYNRALTPEDIAELYRRWGGNLDYNADYRVPEYFNGEQWVAMGETKYIPNAVEFDGVNDYVSHNTPLAGVSNSKMLTASLWFNATATGGPTGFLGLDIGANDPFSLFLGAGGVVRIDAENASGVDILSKTSGFGSLNDDSWHHLILSFDLSDSNKRHVYIDGIDRTSGFSTYSDDEIAFASADEIYIGATGGSLTNLLDGHLADVWIDFGTYIDFDIEANRREFIDENGSPVYLGASGSIPTGAAPDIFLSGDTATWHTNKGTGGGFTENGALEEASNVPGESNPTFTLRGSIAPDLTNLRKLEFSKKIGNHLFVSAAQNDSIRVVDVSDPDSPVLEPVGVTVSTDPQEFDVVGNYLYVTNVTGGGFPPTLHVIDISDPTNIFLAASNQGTDNVSGGHGVKVVGDYVYAGTNNDTTLIWNIANPLSPQYIGLSGPSRAESIRYYKGTLYIGTGTSNAVRSYDISNPVNMVLLNIFNSADHPASVGESREMDFKDDYMFFADKEFDQIVVVDISNPSSLTYVAHLSNVAGELEEPEGLDIEGDVLYVASAVNDTLSAIDISNPANPTLIRTISDGTALDEADSVYVADGFAYVGNESSGIAIVDLGISCSNPRRLEGSLIYNADDQVMQYCDGVNWRAMGPVPGAGAGGCLNPTRAEGSMVFNRDYSVMQYCEGDEWVVVGKDCPNIGGLCLDGTVYAGSSPDGNVPMYTTPADAGLLTWNDGTANYTDMTMVNCTDGTQSSCNTGLANTAFLVGATGEPDYPFAAAEYCDGLSAHGHTDWYLPAMEELNVLYTNEVAIGGFNVSGVFPAGSYWSSSEWSNSRGATPRFSDGFQDALLKNNGLSVRCVRKD